MLPFFCLTLVPPQLGYGPMNVVITSQCACMFLFTQTTANEKQNSQLAVVLYAAYLFLEAFAVQHLK